MALNSAAILSIVDPPNYQDTPYRFGKMCGNCKVKDEGQHSTSCKKYGVRVKPAYVYDSWESDGVFRVH